MSPSQHTGFSFRLFRVSVKICFPGMKGEEMPDIVGIHNAWDGLGTGDEMGNERQQMFVVGWVTNACGGYM